MPFVRSTLVSTDRLCPAPMTGKHVKLGSSVLFTISCIALAACSPSQPSGNRQESVPVGSTSDTSTPILTDPLDAASSSAENLAEAVIANNAAAGDKAYTELQAALNTLRPAALGQSATIVNEINQSLNDGWQAGDRSAAAMAAVSLYAKLQQAKNWTGSAVPLAVSMLDHAGFKSELLAAQGTVDWSAIAATADDARRELASIDSSMKDKNLKLVLDGIVGHLSAGAKSRDLARVQGAARDLLAAVDLLEQQYTRQAASSGGKR